MLVAVLCGLSLLSLASGEWVGPSIWPQPMKFSYGNISLPISSSVQFQLLSDNVPITIPTLTNAFLRYQQLMFIELAEENKDKNKFIETITVSVENISEEYPQLETDESYSLSISDTGESLITAKTVYGALRALESLSQLVLFDSLTGIYSIIGAPIDITDAPRYPHRGLLLDTSRHFQPIAALKRTIDSLSYAKYNGLCLSLSLSLFFSHSVSVSLSPHSLTSLSLSPLTVSPSLAYCRHTKFPI
jgi:hexosaminidase